MSPAQHSFFLSENQNSLHSVCFRLKLLKADFPTILFSEMIKMASITQFIAVIVIAILASTAIAVGASTMLAVGPQGPEGPKGDKATQALRDHKDQLGLRGHKE
jgi:hypothetical protein